MCCRLLRSILGLLMGGFILWQLAFLLGMNFCEVTRHCLSYYADQQDGPPGLINPARAEGRYFAQFEQLFTRWAEFTDQPQSWSLFAPNVWSQTPFVAVELRWDDGAPGSAQQAGAMHSPVLLLSDNEPPDVTRYLRFGYFRLRRFESNIDVGFTIDTDKTPEDMQDHWRQNIFKKVRDQALAIRAYLEWRVNRYLQEHSDAGMPRQAILHVRVYAIPEPTRPRHWNSAEPTDHVLARWRPHFPYANNSQPVEVYDPIAERFDLLP